MTERRRRTEFAPRQVKSNVTEEKFQAYLAARAQAKAEEEAAAAQEAENAADHDE